MSKQKQYNYNLNFIKGIACIFVVFMHCDFPGIMGTAVQVVSRVGVPFFFMVSSYFCFKSLAVTTELKTSKVLTRGDFFDWQIVGTYWKDNLLGFGFLFGLYAAFTVVFSQSEFSSLKEKYLIG